MVTAYASHHRAPNSLIGAAATLALLGVAWLGHALAHTTVPSDGAWRATRVQAAATLKRATATAPKPGSADFIVNAPPPPQIFQALTPQAAAQKNAQVPFSTLPNPPADPLRLDTATALDRTRALDCLTMAVYYEAASEPDQGQAAVAQVVLNRLRNPLFPKTICGVVFEGAQLTTGCQFTFTCDGSLRRRPSEAGWSRARRVAERALNGYVEKSVGEATHYHTVWVVPYWQPTVVKLTQIGAHIFYRWSGGMGQPASFAGRYAGGEQAPPTILGLTQTGAIVAAPTIKTVAVAAPPTAAPVVVARVVAPVQSPPLTSAATELAQIQPMPRSNAYFGRPSDQVRRLPVGSGW